MIINGVKFACATCIKGHRSSSCHHSKRPLFEIRPKGRPVSQCAYCRDLRKTRQVHIKCSCGDKKAKADLAANVSVSSLAPSQSMLLFRQDCNTHDGSLPCQDAVQPFQATTADHLQVRDNQQCSCPQRKKSATRSAFSQQQQQQQVSTLQQHEQQQQQQQQHEQQQQQQQQQQIQTQQQSQQQQLQQPQQLLATPLQYPCDTSYSWALVPQQLQDMTGTDELGFIFRKPSMQRFLEGQPQCPRRRPSCKRSSPRATSPTHGTGGYVAAPASIPSSYPSDSSAASSSAVALPPDFLEELEYTMQTASPTSSVDAFGLANADELSAILSNVLNDPADMLQQQQQQTSPSASLPSTPMFMPHCGSFAPLPICQPNAQPNQASESVVVTIAPLSSQKSTQEAVTTRIVTCYCGPACTCPGCLVHPGNYFLGSDTLDPYAGIYNPASSSASSSCCGSDDEEYKL